MIEAVRGGLTPGLEAEILDFWPAVGGLAADEARRRLPDVVCVLRCDGILAGLTTAHAADVALIGGRRFWIYGSALVGRCGRPGPGR